MIKTKKEIMDIFKTLSDDRIDDQGKIIDYIMCKELKLTQEELRIIGLSSRRDLEDPDNEEYFRWYVTGLGKAIRQLSATIVQIYNYGIADESDDNLDSQEKWKNSM